MTSSYPPYYMDYIAESPAPIPSAVLMAENIPDIDMKIRDSEFKMKGELIQLRNKVLKIETEVGLCCPNYDKMATNIQSRFRGKKDRTEMTQKYPEVFNKVTKGWVVKIESRAGDLVDRIELHLKDGSVKEYGEESGWPMDSFILGKDEKITKILKYGRGPQFLGKRIDIITNLNRIYKIAGVFCKAPCNPRKDLTYEGEPIVEFNISPNKELIGLIFDKGELIGIEETELEGGYSKKKTKRKSKRKKRKSKRKKRKSKKKTKRKNN